VPELPEVERECRRLRRVMAGARLERVELRRPDLRAPFPPDFVARLEGQTVVRLTRRAKYLMAALSSGDALLMHLGMSGSFRLVSPTPGTRLADYHHPRGEDERHDHVVFHMSSGTRVVFNDPRRFGSMTLIGQDDETAHPALAALGPEPLARGFDARTLARSLRGRRTSLKAALLDQRVVAGLGNIYVSEALHLARLSPKRIASTMVTAGGEPRPGLVELAAAIRTVLRKAINRGARYQGRDDRFVVYDRDGRRCVRRGCSGVIRRIVQGGRSTFYCPVCQR